MLIQQQVTARTVRLLGAAMVCFAIQAIMSAADAQVAPVRYWVPGGPFGFGGGATDNLSAGWSDVPGFAGLSSVDEDGVRTGFVARSYSAPVNAFSSGLGYGALGWGGLGGPGGFGNFATLTSEGSQYGYSLKGGSGLVTLFGGVDQLKYQPDVFTSLTSPGFTSSNTAATVVHGGVEFRPSSNVSLSFSAGYAQPSGLVDSDIRSSLLPGESPMFSGGRR